MNLQQFVVEKKDDDPEWENLFSKSDILFLGNVNYEQFKSDLANYLFETQHSQQSLEEFVEIGCEEELGENSKLVSSALIDFLHVQERARFDTKNPDKFICEFKKYFGIRANTQDIDSDNICDVIKEILVTASTMRRGAFVNFNPDNLPDTDLDSNEFAHMTGLIGEVLAKLVFQQLKGCGDLVRTKTFLDNPNMPRHGEDLIGFVFDPSDTTKDILHLVEAKSTKGAVSTQVDQIQERFSRYLKNIPYDEINRFKLELQHNEKEKIRTRVTRLVYQARKNPNHKQVLANAFLHYPSNYNPQKPTIKKLGDIQITKKDGSIIKMDSTRIYVITFRFDDFEETVREIFEKAWTI